MGLVVGTDAVVGAIYARILLVSFALIALVHNQWSQRERLAYPLQPSNLLLDSIEKPRKGILRSKLLGSASSLHGTFPRLTHSISSLTLNSLVIWAFPVGKSRFANSVSLIN